MTTVSFVSHALRHFAVCGGLLLFAIGFPAQALAAPEDVTASVQDGKLTIARALGSNDGFFFVGITLEGHLDEDIRVYVGNDLLGTFSRSGIAAIDIDADQSLVRLGAVSSFEFEGDINVDVRSGGECDLFLLNMLGNLHLRGSAGGIRVTYFSAVVDGSLTLHGGPGEDALVVDQSGFGFLAVSGPLTIDGGPGNEFISLADSFVGGDTVINLGQSGGGEPTSTDRDVLRFDFCELSGSVIITGDEGDDDLRVFSTQVGGNVLVDMGNGADLVRLSGLSLAADALVFLDGGNGNSDELVLNGFPLLADEYTDFETVIP